MEKIVNKVAESGLITLDLQQFVLADNEIAVFDIKDFLFRELLLREKDFRAAMSALDWDVYTHKYVAVCCSSEAIVPMWAYMLVGTYLENVASDYYFGTTSNLRDMVMTKRITALDITNYQDGRIIIKGCGDEAIAENGFLKITQRLKPVVKSLMYGEPCSTVPIFKKK